MVEFGPLGVREPSTKERISASKRSKPPPRQNPKNDYASRRRELHGFGIGDSDIPLPRNRSLPNHGAVWRRIYGHQCEWQSFDQSRCPEGVQQINARRCLGSPQPSVAQARGTRWARSTTVMMICLPLQIEVWWAHDAALPHVTGRNLPKIRQPREPEASTVTEKTIADFTRVVEQTGILAREAPPDLPPYLREPRPPHLPRHPLP